MSKQKTMINRRNLLLGASAVALGAFGPGGMAPRLAVAQSRFSFDAELAIPPLLDGTLSGNTREFKLSLQDGETRFFPELLTKTRGINGSYLGPALHFRKGETVRIEVSNNLGRDSTLHWHGFNLPAKADGGPHQVISAGASWAPEFEVREEASMMWYHSHLMGETAEQVWSGLAGLVIVSDDQSGMQDLPDEYGVDDVPVVLQDRRFYRDGSMPYEMSMHDRMAGMMGNIPMVNGTILPHFQVTTDRVRLRLLNGSNASLYKLAFSDGRSFRQIASDGGLLEGPVSLTQLSLAPGERAEIIVEFTPGDSVVLQSLGATGGGGMMGMSAEQSPAFEFMELRAGDTLRPLARVPEKLASLPDATPPEDAQTRRFLLEMPGMGMGMMMGRGFTINGEEMDMKRVNFSVRMGETEIWEIENAGPMAHPFHVHNTQFRILDRDGQTPSPNEAGRKDTVLVHPGETVHIMVRFDHYSDADLPYMYHCHILEHEDAGMMGQFVVV